jgi:hypothetical protein
MTPTHRLLISGIVLVMMGVGVVVPTVYSRIIRTDTVLEAINRAQSNISKIFNTSSIIFESRKEEFIKTLTNTLLVNESRASIIASDIEKGIRTWIGHTNEIFETHLTLLDHFREAYEEFFTVSEGLRDELQNIKSDIEQMRNRRYNALVVVLDKYKERYENEVELSNFFTSFLQQIKEKLEEYTQKEVIKELDLLEQKLLGN